MLLIIFCYRRPKQAHDFEATSIERFQRQDSALFQRSVHAGYGFPKLKEKKTLIDNF